MRKKSTENTELYGMLRLIAVSDDSMFMFANKELENAEITDRCIVYDSDSGNFAPVICIGSWTARVNPWEKPTSDQLKRAEQCVDRIPKQILREFYSLSYQDVVRRAQNRNRNGSSKVKFIDCETWRSGDQVNLWTYWQGYQLKDISEKGVDILLVGQDWGNPKNNPKVIASIESIQRGEKVFYEVTSHTDRTMARMFKAFGEDIDIMNIKPGLRLFFTNYSLGYRGCSETGGMTKSIMKQDEDLFNDLVLAIRPKIIICLGKITYEMATRTVTKGFVKQLREGIPFKAPFPLDESIPVYGVAHCGARGCRNVGGEDNMKKAWIKIAEEFK